MADWTCSACNWVNRDHADKCLSCGADKSTGVPVATPSVVRPARPGGGMAPAMPGGGSAAMPTASPAASGFVGGLLAGLAAAVLGTGLWYAVVAFSEYQVGFVAAIVGWLIGSAVVFGARGRVGLPLIPVSGLLTVAALVVSEYLIFYHFMTQELGVQFDLLQPPDVILEIVLESISAEPSTLLFWGFAVVAAIYIPFKRMQAPTEP